MKKRILALALTLAMLICIMPAASADSSKAYWHEKKAACTDSFYSDWQAGISDSTRVNDVSVPGTHDTMAFKGTVLLSDIMLTQSMTLSQQLNSGLRYFDIRICYKGDYFEIHHNFVDLKSDFDDVLGTIKAFFAEHPSEFVVMRLQQEYSSASRSKVSALLADYLAKPEYSSLFYAGKTVNPKVSELRGKIFVLAQEMDCAGAKDYYAVNCQDFFEFTTNWDLYKKWELIKAQLELANSDDGTSMYLNHLSGAHGSMPYFVASGKMNHGTNAPQLSTGIVISKPSNKYPDFPRKALLFGTQEIDFMGTNQLVTDYLNSHELSKVGLIAADFPGEALIRAIIDCNFR